MPPSNAASGARWKARSKQFLERRGYVVWDMEVVRTNWTSSGPLPVKRDQLGADLGAMNEAEVLFVQVKGTRTERRPSLAPARRAFQQFRWARCTRREIHVWRLGASNPEVVECQ